MNFPSDPDECEAYGHDLDTGAPYAPEKYKARMPNGRAILKTTEYQPPSEEPDHDYPFFATTGRLVYHFHTRTKTGRSELLRKAAPDAHVQLNPEDAQRLASLPVTGSGSRLVAAAWKARPTWAISKKATSSCRFTTATGIIRSARAPRTS